MSGAPCSRARAIARRSWQSSDHQFIGEREVDAVKRTRPELVHDDRQPPLEVADGLGAPVRVAGPDLLAMQPLRGLDLKPGRRRGPVGRIVKPKRSRTGGALGSSVISNPRASIASAERASSSARLRPGQKRGPAPKVSK